MRARSGDQCARGGQHLLLGGQHLLLDGWSIVACSIRDPIGVWQ
jgi:hypothetical protein